MTNGFAFALTIALGASSTASVRFAEEIPGGVGDGAIFELTLSEGGKVAACTFGSLVDISGQEKAGTPSHAYISDACRKLSASRWRVQKASNGEIKSTYYFCRRLDSAPDFAFCEKRFGP